MEQQMDIITREIPSKGKGYLVVQRCAPEEIYALVGRGAAELLAQGAAEIYAASRDASAPLDEGLHGGYRLERAHDMLGMDRALDGGRPRPRGRLTLEPLTREKGGLFLGIYNESFHAVPNSATYGPEELDEILGDRYRCGFALLDGTPVGIYECGFKKEHPEIGSIGLTKSARGKGLGRELLLSVMDMLAEMGCKRCWLQASTANEAAYPLYLSVGFARESLLSRWFAVKAEGDLRGAL